MSVLLIAPAAKATLSWLYQTLLYIFGFNERSLWYLLSIFLIFPLMALSYFIKPIFPVLIAVLPMVFTYIPPFHAHGFRSKPTDPPEPQLEAVARALQLGPIDEPFRIQDMVNQQRDHVLTLGLAAWQALTFVTLLIVCMAAPALTLIPTVGLLVLRGVILAVGVALVIVSLVSEVLLAPIIIFWPSPLSSSTRTVFTWIHGATTGIITPISAVFIATSPISPGMTGIIATLPLFTLTAWCLAHPRSGIIAAAPLLIPVWWMTIPAAILRVTLPRLSRGARLTLLHIHIAIEPWVSDQTPAWRTPATIILILLAPILPVYHIIVGLLGLDLAPLAGSPLLLPLPPGTMGRLTPPHRVDPAPEPAVYAVLAASLLPGLAIAGRTVKGIGPRLIATLAGRPVPSDIYHSALKLGAGHTVVARADDQTLLIVPRDGGFTPTVTLHGLEFAGTSCHDKEVTALDELLQGAQSRHPLSPVAPAGVAHLPWYSRSTFNATYFIDSGPDFIDGLMQVLPFALGFVIINLSRSPTHASRRIADRIAELATSVTTLPPAQRPDAPWVGSLCAALPALTPADVELIRAIVHGLGPAVSRETFDSAWAGVPPSGTWLDHRLLGAWGPPVRVTPPLPSRAPSSLRITPDLDSLLAQLDAGDHDNYDDDDVHAGLHTPGPDRPASRTAIPEVNTDMNVYHLETANALWPAALRLAARTQYERVMLGQLYTGDLDTDTARGIVADLAELFSTCCLHPTPDAAWGGALARGVPSCFTIARGTDGWVGRTVTGVQAEVLLATIPNEVVHGLWAMAALDIAMGSDDDERYSIQANVHLLRNIMVQSIGLPFGYPILHGKVRM